MRKASACQGSRSLSETPEGDASPVSHNNPLGTCYLQDNWCDAEPQILLRTPVSREEEGCRGEQGVSSRSGDGAVEPGGYVPSEGQQVHLRPQEPVVAGRQVRSLGHGTWGGGRRKERWSSRSTHVQFCSCFMAQRASFCRKSSRLPGSHSLEWNWRELAKP